VLAGVCASDPFRLIDRFLDDVRNAGFAGVQNFPTVGLIDGQFRANLEETGMGYDNEVRLIRLARDRNLLTTPYVFDVAQTREMIAAGADIIVAHMGLTTKGAIGAHTARTLDDCVRDVQAIANAAREGRDDTIVLCHGGPIAMPEDAQYVLSRTHGVHGFYGASSLERLPIETALTEQVRRFKAIRLPKEA
jgi:predicted TIM-barrel enzyme